MDEDRGFSYIEDNEGCKLFAVKVTSKRGNGEDKYVSFEFEVYDNICTYEDGTVSAEDLELYLHGFIKWDGCSHIWFGNDKEAPDGYVHLCGKGWWEAHCLLMQELYKMAVEWFKPYGGIDE